MLVREGRTNEQRSARTPPSARAFAAATAATAADYRFREASVAIITLIINDRVLLLLLLLFLLLG